jgi:hypothetical protein
MKKNLLIIASLFVVVHSGKAQGTAESVVSRNIEMRPSEKRFLTLKASERNAYSNRAPKEDKNKDEEHNVEEIAIRKKLDALSVSGTSRNSNGLRLLLGDILLERGMVLPQLIPNQTQHLKVVDVAEEKIVLGWLDVESGELTGKTLQINYDVKPVIRYVLQGQTAPVGGLLAAPEMGVLKPKRVSYDADYLSGQ